MKGFGSLLVVLGLLAIVFGFMDRVPTLLQWIYQWGEGPAWAIKMGIIVLGVIIYVIGNRKKAEEQTPPQN